MSGAKWSGGLAHWRDGDKAMVSIAFTWKVREAVDVARYYGSLGLTVYAGGPGLFTRPMADMMRKVAIVADNGVGELPDAVAKHNPLATTASRGCTVQGCAACIVPAMEGKEFTFLPDFTPRPILTDNNLSALPSDYQQYIVDRYEAARVPLLDANSGFEPKTFDDEIFHRWKVINRGPWRFGLDDTFETADAERVILMLKRNGVSARRIQVYVMIGHEPFAECMRRIQCVIDMGGEPYVQPVMKLNAIEKKPWVRHDWTHQRLSHVQRWANRRIWRVSPFDQYDASAKTVKSAEPHMLFTALQQGGSGK